ncbi:UNVERIFIED_CONTAM: hypothetical protein FKN15_021011 [Acipenser sinensis]
MNGIIHPCTHPEDKAAPKNEDEMMVAIFEYIDRLYNIVRPRKVLYMAIDGVAPRAKMNQQRSRRFRASKEGVELTEEKSRIREEVLQRADLIMLGLATHEPNFTIIREEFKPNKPRPCGLCGQVGHEIKDCQGVAREKQGEHDQFADSLPCSEQEFIFIRIAVLREYLERELTMASLPFPFDIERSIDDWVFMCFFVGNDFLPHLPSLEIREGAIDRLVGIYKDVVHRTGADKPAFLPSGQFAPQALGRRGGPQPVDNPRHAAFNMRMHGRDQQNMTPSGSRDASDGSPSPSGGVKRKAQDSDSEPEPEDNIRLWEEGWKQRYYKNKFDVDASDEKFRRKVVKSYVEGLCWVLRYYYQGCASWKWYFPFHYAPFASDFKDIKGMFTEFELGTKPFKPLEQLMSVFPAASGNFLPVSWQKLMTDPNSSIIDFYPDDFAIDLNGKKYAWQVKRNSLGSDVLFIGKHHPLCDFIRELYRVKSTESVDMPPELCHGIKGALDLDENAILPDK